MKKLTHVDRQGRAKMVDVTEKPETLREAVARASVYMKAHTLRLIQDGKVEKGDVFCVSRVAGILAAKKTGELIPMCHPLNLTAVDLAFTVDEKQHKLEIHARVRTTDRTGVEMEALTAVSVAALTIYDMCKAVDKNMVIESICLLEKSGGKTTYVRNTK